MEEIKALSLLLRCPLSGQRLHLATPEEIIRLSGYVADAFLVCQDGSSAYPINKGIPSLLPQSALALKALI